MVCWDTVSMVRAGSATPLPAFAHALTTVATLTAAHVIIISAILAPLFSFAMGHKRINQQIAAFARRAAAAVSSRPPSNAVTIHAAIMAIPFAMLSYAMVVFPIAMHVHNNVRVASNAAGASILIHLGGLAVGCFTYAACRGAIRSALAPIAARNIFGCLLSRPWITAIALACLALAAATTAGVLHRRFLAAIDFTWVWKTLVIVTAGVIGATLRTLPKISASSRRAIGWSLIFVASVVTVIAAVALPYSAQSRSLLFTHAKFGAAFHASHNRFFDHDGDGYTTLFGGNDCAPYDPAIHPGAIDIPYNGIDEDCSGADLQFDTTLPQKRWDHPLPAGFPKRPHIILLTVDTLAPTHLGFSGYARPTSPNLDNLASHSVRFDSAFAQGPSTRLSVPSLLTSLYDPQIKRSSVGRHPYPILPENLTIAEILRDHGYQTIAVVPNTYFTGWNGITQGFNIVDSTATKVKGPHTSEAVSDAIIQRLDTAIEGDKPIFLWAHYFDPHGPFDQPHDAPVFGTTEVDRYDAEIWHTDNQLGRVLTWLDESLPSEDRILIVTSDHGESFEGRHAVQHHGYDLHTAILHVPLLVQTPAFTPKTVKGIVSLLDIAPTLVNITQATGTFPFEGTSLVPALDRGEGLEDRVVFHAFYLQELVKEKKEPLRMVAARTEQFNLVFNRETGIYSLYNFVADSSETQDLFFRRNDIADQLVPQLQLWLFQMLNPAGTTQQAAESDTSHPLAVPSPPSSAIRMPPFGGPQRAVR